MTTPALAPPRTSPQTRFRRIALFVRALIVLGVVVLVANILSGWFVPDYAMKIIKLQTDLDNIPPLILRTRILFAAWDALTSLVVLTALAHLWRLFGEYLHARVFSVRALASLRGFARWMLATAVVSPIYSSVLSVIVTWENGPGHRQIALDVSSDDYAALLFGAVILAISSVMAEAARIAEDNEGFV